MHDLLPEQGHDLFKFWEINDNVSETVQHGDIVAVKD